MTQEIEIDGETEPAAAAKRIQIDQADAFKAFKVLMHKCDQEYLVKLGRLINNVTSVFEEDKLS